MKRISFIFKGRVQGVSYRWIVINKARGLGLKGFVKNLANSSVRVVAKGDEDKIKQLLSFCRENPGHSRVDNVEVEEEETISVPEYDDFKVEF